MLVLTDGLRANTSCGTAMNELIDRAEFPLPRRRETRMQARLAREAELIGRVMAHSHHELSIRCLALGLPIESPDLESLRHQLFLYLRQRD